MRKRVKRKSTNLDFIFHNFLYYFSRVPSWQRIYEICRPFIYFHYLGWLTEHQDGWMNGWQDVNDEKNQKKRGEKKFCVIKIYYFLQ